MRLCDRKVTRRKTRVKRRAYTLRDKEPQTALQDRSNSVDSRASFMKGLFLYPATCRTRGLQFLKAQT